MFFVHMFIIICAFATAESIYTVCNSSYANHRSQYSKYLADEGVIFIAVGYSFIGEENIGEDVNSLRKQISKSTSDLLPPITLVQYKAEDTRSSLIVSSITGIYYSTFNSLCNHTMDQFEHDSRCLSDTEEVKAYIFSSTRIESSAQIIFNACRMQIDSHGTMQVEKSFVVLVSSQESLDPPELSSNTMKNLTMTIYEFDEFKDQGFCICDHLEFYINECPTERNEIGYTQNVYLLIGFMFVVGVVFALLYNFIMMEKEVSSYIN